MKVSKNNAVQAGFSLVEMLVVIAVIGIIAAIAVPNIGRINDSAKDAKQRRNAQNLASIYSSAQAAGWDFGFADGSNDAGDADSDVDTIIDAIKAGKTIESTGPFNGTYFGVPGIDATEAKDTATGAAKYLSYDTTSKMLLYTGGQEGIAAPAAVAP